MEAGNEDPQVGVDPASSEGVLDFGVVQDGGPFASSVI